MELEEKLRRAAEKVMNSKTEIEPNQIIKDGDYIYFRGEKYQKVETLQSFYDKLWELLKEKLGDNTNCDETTDRVMDLIRKNIPEPKVYDGEDYDAGYNQAIEDITKKINNYY